ncbi:MAG TPA: hypothetical protein VG917_04490 [Patescibacteria group bacterium]|nr:hypothetical protein [Patescibacteria group bacterium]
MANQENDLVFTYRVMWGERSRNLSKADKRDTLAYFSGYKQALMRGLKDKKTDIAGEIRDSRESGKGHSVPGLITARLMVDLSGVMGKDALVEMGKNEMNHFFVLADASVGAGVIINSISSGEEYIAGTAGQVVQESMDYVRVVNGVELDAVKDAEYYLKLIDQAKRRSDTLIKDNSGEKTVEEQLKSMRRQLFAADYHGLLIPEFTLAGAQLAVDAYKYLYAVVNK